MEKKNRLRGPNFTKSDSILLCDIINNIKDIIECKKTDGVNLMEKHKAWQEVVKIYNSSTTGSQRTLESLQQNYKNLKKKCKKSASDAKMNIPVEALVHNVEEFGTSSDGWEKISHSMGLSTETCQEVLADLKKEADRKAAILKKNVMGTGGGPAPNYDPDPLLEKVKVLVGPAIDGLYTIYDGDSCLMASQPAAEPVEAINMQIDTQGDNQHGEKNTTLQHTNITQQDEEYFTNDRANLKKKPHSLLVQNIKNKKKNHSEMSQKQSVSTKFISLASEKLELVALQKELLQVQVKEETEKSEHGRLLRAMEMEDAKKDMNIMN